MTAQPPDLLAELDAASRCPHGVELDMEDACDRCERTVSHVTHEYMVRYPSTDEVDEFTDLSDALNWMRAYPAEGSLFERTVTTTVECGDWAPMEGRLP